MAEYLANQLLERQQIEIYVSCRSLLDQDYLSKSDPYIILYQKDKFNKWNKVGQTEVIKNNLNPDFQKTFIIDFIFETQQIIKFEVQDKDSETKSDYIGNTETTVGKLMGSKDQLLILDLKNMKGKYGGKIVIRAEKIDYCNDSIFLQVKCQNLPCTRFFGKTNPFIKLFKTQNKLPVMIYQSSQIMANLNPIFRPFELKSQKLCNGNYDQKNILQIWDYRTSGNHIFVCEIEFTVNDLLIKKQYKHQLRNEKKKNAGNLIFEQVSLIERPSFVDYLRGGTQLQLIVAIDFTGSNGVPTRPESLHAINLNGMLNQYQQAIMAVGGIVINYSHEQRIPVYGFGAKPKMPHFNFPQTLHCFPLNGYPQQPDIIGLQGLMNVYQQSLTQLELSGPTYFNPLLQESMKVAQISKNQQINQYYILLILTDGDIHDMNQTIQSLVQASSLPLSVIIIGIGNADFTNMVQLDGDNVRLTDEKGKKADRDIVQFVEFNKYKNDPQQLAQEVLAELPDQIVNYFSLINQKPLKPNEINMQKMDILNIPQQNQNFGNKLIQGGFMNNIISNINQNNFSPVDQYQAQNQQQFQQPIEQAQINNQFNTNDPQFQHLNQEPTNLQQQSIQNQFQNQQIGIINQQQYFSPRIENNQNYNQQYMTLQQQSMQYNNQQNINYQQMPQQFQQPNQPNISDYNYPSINNQ